MPIVHVKGHEPSSADLIERGLGTVAGAVADAIENDVSGVWCTFTSVTQTIGSQVPAPDERILYLDLLMKPRGRDAAEAALEAAAGAAAHAFEVRRENVWAHLVEIGSGQVFAGGELQ
jgi:hypothetical protein